MTLVLVVVVEGRSLTSGQRLSIGFPSGKKPPRTALSDHNQTKQQATNAHMRGRGERRRKVLKRNVFASCLRLVQNLAKGCGRRV